MIVLWFCFLFFVLFFLLFFVVIITKASTGVVIRFRDMQHFFILLTVSRLIFERIQYFTNFVYLAWLLHSYYRIQAIIRHLLPGKMTGISAQAFYYAKSKTRLNIVCVCTAQSDEIERKRIWIFCSVSSPTPTKMLFGPSTRNNKPQLKKKHTN